MARRLGSHLARAALATLVTIHAVGAQTTSADLESRLASQTGLARARTLTQLVTALRLDAPQRALRYGAEALALFRATPDPKTNVLALADMGWAHMTLGRYDSATFYEDSARRFAARVGDRTGAAHALSNLGALAQRMGDPTRAVNLFEQSLAIQRAVGDSVDIANSLNNLGFVYSTDLADYGRSIADHLEALAIRQRLGDKAAIALSLNNIGIVYERLRQYDRALSYFMQALQLRRDVGNLSRVAATLNNIGDCYFEKGDYARSLSYQQQALAIRATLGDRSYIALSHRDVGLVYLKLNRADSARAELMRALAMSDHIPDKGLATNIRLALSQEERARGAPARARTYANQALTIAQQMESRELVRQATEELGKDDEAQGELSTALEEYKRSRAVSDSIFNENTARRIALLEQRESDAERAHELDSLQRVQAELRLRASERAIQRDSVIGLALLAAVITFFMFRRRIERARLAEALSMSDALTGLWNRRYVQQTIQMDVSASVRRHRVALARGESADDADLIFMLLDVDRFKTVNDEFGHAAGDQLLVQLAAALRGACRNSDVVARWGGEEFLIIARFTDRLQAPLTAERLRQAVDRHVTTLPDGRRIRITCSIGFAAFPFNTRDGEALPWNAVLELADLACLVAKREGRNGWVGLNGERAGGAKVERAPRSVDELEQWIAEGRLVCLSSRAAPPVETPASGVAAAR